MIKKFKNTLELLDYDFKVGFTCRAVVLGGLCVFLKYFLVFFLTFSFTWELVFNNSCFIT
jgi:hypothetical protein